MQLARFSCKDLTISVFPYHCRSVELDQKWTWEQLRAMQVGGNAKARAFFRAQNSGFSADDLQRKYNSRAAILYKSKISSAATEAMKRYDCSVSVILLMIVWCGPCLLQKDQLQNQTPYITTLYYTLHYYYYYNS